MVSIPLYARHDLVSVTVSVTDGGCGLGHARPVVDGAPAKIWALDCPRCHTHLATNGQWSTTLAEIPETPDEKLVREDWEHRGAADQQYVTAMALSKLAGVDIPESLTRVVSAASAPVTATVAPSVRCFDGHVNPAGQRFCGECGTPMAAPPPVAPSAPADPPAEFAVDSLVVEDVPLPGDLAGLGYNELRKLAARRGVKQAGTKAELLERLAAAEVAA